ncbi:MAG: 2-oxoglutarate dehydrogenase complex dihydrolipoyllysine-residue succinyltransferase [Alphaproteobacteria bacterium]|nr:2-oxoglutarate dehydrogenase complex dihydrolipoyllysine-residue succinyltransferase [Alphaproteobacteria bacterium]
MTTKIIVPSLGESVSEATVAKWFKQVGDAVKQDEQLLELETDKVTLEVNAPASGVLTEILVKEGDSVDVGKLLGHIDETAKGGATAKKDEVKPAAPSNPPSAGGSAAPTQSPKEDVKPAAEKAETNKSQPAKKSDGDTQSPAVRKIVAENNIDTGRLQGTGKDGRLTKGDVLNAPAQSAAPAAPKAARPDQPNEERVKMSKLRQVIAKRLKESQNTAAILTTFNEIDMTNVINLRNEYKDAFEKKHGIRLGFMGFFVKAAVHALKEIPAVNAEIDGDSIIYKNHYDIGVAVGTENGLVVPVVRNADQLSLAEIEGEINELAKKARNGTLTMADMSGGTFTVSNGGVYGSLMSTPIINPPQSGILGMHKTEERPIAVKGQVVIRPMMYVALSYDHRIIDGRESVTFLVKIKEAIEDPRRLILGL